MCVSQKICSAFNFKDHREDTVKKTANTLLKYLKHELQKCENDVTLSINYVIWAEMKYPNFASIIIKNKKQQS